MDRVAMGLEPMSGNRFKGETVVRDRLMKEETKAIIRIRVLRNGADLKVPRETLGQMRRKTSMEDLLPRPGIVLLDLLLPRKNRSRILARELKMAKPLHQRYTPIDILK